MNCRDVSDLLPDHVAGALAEDVERAFAEHAAECSCCTHLVATYGFVVVLARLSRPEPPSSGPSTIAS